MIKIVTAVEKYEIKPGDVCIFLSGSIDNGNAGLYVFCPQDFYRYENQ